jgi:DNA-binding LacI/PurR family transcriptional regulator/anti-anti-sigma regulatory factor
MAKKRTGKSRSKWVRGKRPTIGWLTYGMRDLAVEMAAGAADAAHAGDANLMTVAGESLRSPYRFEHCANVLYDLVGAGSLDGLVIWGGGLGAYVPVDETRAFYERFRPLPTVGVAWRPIEGIPNVLLDSYEGVRSTVEHLVEVHGYRRIVYLRGPEEHAEAEERYRGYRDVLAAHDIAFDPELVVAGDFRRSSGVRAVGVLLDERAVEFEALVGVNDSATLGALEALQARGVRVPQDVAVVGFDDIDQAHNASPPLTTVAFRAYDQAYRAVEVLLAMLAGEEMPAEVRLPAEMVVRRSCGCMLTPVSAAAGEVERKAKGFEAAFARRRERIAAGVAEAVDLPAGEWAGGLVDAFAGDVSSGSTGGFVAALEEVIGGMAAGGRSAGPRPWSGENSEQAGAVVARWHGALSALRRGVLPALGDPQAWHRAEDLFQQARVVVGEAAQRAGGLAAVRAVARAEILREVGASLITTFDVRELMDVLAEGLPRLGIAAAYLAVYEDSEEPTGQARLVLAYDEWGRAGLDGGGRPFPSRGLVPDGVLPERRFSLVMEALVFREHQLGFALFDEGAHLGAVYDALRGQISSALEGALLLRERARAERALEKAYAEVERQVEERTAELRREVEERERVQEESVRLQQEVIEAQQRAIQELSTPIIPVAERVLVMPLIGSVDSLRARDITRRLLTGIREHRARVVILDVTGVPMIDSGIASHLNRTIQAARLKGARTIVTGISDAVAETIVDLGIDWREVETLADLQTGLRLVMGTP